MRCLIVTPEKTVLDMEAMFVVLPLYDGEFGVLSNHLPVVARIGAGDIRIHKTTQTLQNNEEPVCYYIEGGFVEILDNTIVVMSLYAKSVKDLDVNSAETQLQEAIARPSHTPELAKIREEKLYTGRAKLKIAKKYH
ncbi:MAG: ATP synthase F1 subunit epsilon [Planctomycetaceae bacterium]|jgi:F-type H+-transporting ATPase subunit epsilon|nr:ATP synthase F1 subunit epsilon [Planctomycetaceae bacterium]